MDEFFHGRYVMKRFIVVLLAIALGISLCACGGKTGASGTDTQEFTFQGVTMEIPAAWELSENTQDDDYVEFRMENSDQTIDFFIIATKAYVMPGDGLTHEQAAQNLKQFTEDDATYDSVSEPEIGTFAGQYDMFSVTCKAHTKLIPSGEKDYFCKICKVYKDDQTLTFTFRNTENDFSMFDAAIEGALVE